MDGYSDGKGGRKRKGRKKDGYPKNSRKVERKKLLWTTNGQQRQFRALLKMKKRKRKKKEDGRMKGVK